MEGRSLYFEPEKIDQENWQGELLVLGQGATLTLGKSHVEGHAGHHRLPRLVLGKAPVLDRPPEIDDLFLGNRVE